MWWWFQTCVLWIVCSCPSSLGLMNSCQAKAGRELAGLRVSEHMIYMIERNIVTSIIQLLLFLVSTMEVRQRWGYESSTVAEGLNHWASLSRFRKVSDTKSHGQLGYLNVGGKTWKNHKIASRQTATDTVTTCFLRWWLVSGNCRFSHDTKPQRKHAVES